MPSLPQPLALCSRERCLPGHPRGPSFYGLLSQARSDRELAHVHKFATEHRTFPFLRPCWAVLFTQAALLRVPVGSSALSLKNGCSGYEANRTSATSPRQSLIYTTSECPGCLRRRCLQRCGGGKTLVNWRLCSPLFAGVVLHWIRSTAMSSPCVFRFAC